jgi:hypothetical protein
MAYEVKRLHTPTPQSDIYGRDRGKQGALGSALGKRVQWEVGKEEALRVRLRNRERSGAWARMSPSVRSGKQCDTVPGPAERLGGAPAGSWPRLGSRFDSDGAGTAEHSFLYESRAHMRARLLAGCQCGPFRVDSRVGAARGRQTVIPPPRPRARRPRYDGASAIAGGERARSGRSRGPPAGPRTPTGTSPRAGSLAPPSACKSSAGGGEWGRGA